MQTHPITTPRVAVRGPKLTASPVPTFKGADLNDVRRAFHGASICQMWQAWQPNESRDFAPAVVSVGWRQNVLCIYAELTDADIFTRASAPNQRLWELGDVFEIFLRPEGRQAYLELQISPNNQQLQLCYASSAVLKRARKSGDLSEALVTRQTFSSRIWVERHASRWHVLAEIPAALAGITCDTLAGQQWYFSFSRYDYTQAVEEPVISSTSPHVEADFHRQAEWGLIRFVRGSGSNND